MKKLKIKDRIEILKKMEDFGLVLKVNSKKGRYVGEYLCAEDGILTLIHQVVNNGRGWESSVDIKYKDINNIEGISASEVLECLSEILLQLDVATRVIDPKTMG